MGFLSTLLLAAAVQSQADHVEIQPRQVEIEVGETQQLRAEVYDASGEPVTRVPVMWFSSDSDVVEVDGDGRITAVRPGAARVAAVAAGVLGYADITVPQLPPDRLTLELPVQRVLAGTSAPLRARALNRLGEPVPGAEIEYESSAPEIATVARDGRIFAHRPGSARIRAAAGSARAEIEVPVAENPAERYEIEPGTATARTGDVIRFRVGAADSRGRSVDAGLLPGWSVSGPKARIYEEGEEGAFVAEQPGTYRVSALIGEGRVESAVVEVAPRTYEARLVKMGRGPIDSHHSGDMWVFEGLDGRDYVYIGTFGHDWMNAWDVTDPESPVLTDSVQVDARRINDVKIHPNREIGIITREGASSRRNGIVLLDLSEPAHPSILSEYTETVTGGVHNVWIRGDHDLVYACHNGTGDLHIIDVSDPRNPREVGRWGLQKRFKVLHDVIVQDGYAYLSYWDDGIIMLDVGAGTHGGAPTEPAFVSQYKYPIGHTHVSWRNGRYLFVGDEIFPPDWNPDAPIHARGYIHVLDYSDPENPVEVAKYEVPEAGAHNVWVEDDVLYVGYYQAGLRAVDVSGELRGDLYDQGREIARLLPIDENMAVPNWPMTWGAQLFKGRIYSSDFNSGLWITRLEMPDLVP